MDLRTLAYPRHIHWPSYPGAWVSRVVHNADEATRALSEGGSLVPIDLTVPIEQTSDPPEPPVEIRRGPGRPRKVTP